MQYSSNMTSKGQVTIPADIRRKLGLKPGQAVQFKLSGNVVTVGAPDWREGLAKLHKEVAAHLKRRGLKPLSDEELNEAINRAAQDAAEYRISRMNDSR